MTQLPRILHDHRTAIRRDSTSSQDPKGPGVDELHPLPCFLVE